MNWKIKKIINFETGGLWKDGFAQFGFHDFKGNQYAINADKNWFGRIGPNNSLIWSAGNTDSENGSPHLKFDLLYPVYITDLPDGKLLVSSSGNKKIYRVDPAGRTADVLIDGNTAGLTDIGNCILDHEGNIWVNEIEGCKIWQFSPDGNPMQVLGTGHPGFRQGACKFSDVQFNWIYDIRTGHDGNIYVLDSKNYAVRMIDIASKLVIPIAGTGETGYSGDGGNANKATFGSIPDEHFDGPWSLSLDEEDNIFIGDTQNHVVRMIERSTNIISTIAGKSNIKPGERNNPQETDPLNLNLPKICSMDYYNGNLYIPEWGGDLIVLANR